ncbi:MAG: glucose 1-dehydrogenase [Candidatus Hydrogenedentota bacterium]
MVSFDLTGKVALVTGASRGIGEAVAKGLAEQGAAVVLTSRKQEGLEAAAAAINEAGGQAVPIACHVGKPAMVEALFTRITESFGKLDILVNNAATNPYFGPVLDAPEWAYDKTFEVNCKGYFLVAQQAARMMAKQGSGSIINIASVEGITPSPMMGVYSMTKAAVVMMTKVFAKELGGSNVRCNCIAPGLTNTHFAQVLIDTPEIHEHYTSRAPLGRHAEPEEIVGAAVYLASDAATYTTGAVIPVDGGTAA